MAFWRRLKGNFQSRKLRDEIRDELHFHQEMRAREYRERGLEPAAAAAETRRRLGAESPLLEATHDSDIVVWLESLGQDLRHALRAMRRSPAFTAAVVLSLAVGIGCNAAIFSLTDAILLRRLPVSHPEQLYLLSQTDGQDQSDLFSWPLIQQMQARVAPVAELSASTPTGRFYMPAAGSTPQRLNGQLVSWNYFSSLGVHPALGRLITPADDDVPGGSPVVVLSYPFWQRQFGRDTRVLGTTLTLNGQPLLIIGVAADGFFGLHPNSGPDLWAPLAQQPFLRYNSNAMNANGDTSHPWPDSEGIMWLDISARLPRPADASRLSTLLTPLLQASWHRIDSTQPAPWVVVTQPGGQGTDGWRLEYRQPLVALMAMVGLMLLIVCANVATLLIARGVSRQRELAIRISIGISRPRLIRQLLTEGLLLAALGGGLGLLVARWGATALAHLANNGRLPQAVATVDWRVWGFLAAVSIATGIMVSLYPALQSGRVDPATVMKADRSGGSESAAAGASRMGRGLVVAQVALSLLLVAGAGLFSRSLAALAHLDPGFRRDHLLSLQVEPRAAGYPVAQLPGLYRAISDRVAAVPGVVSVSFSTCDVPATCTEAGAIYFAGRPNKPDGEGSEQEYVTPTYLATIGTSILRGRGLTDSDIAQSPGVVLVNQAFARKYFPAGNALGQRMGDDSTHAGAYQIVGIVANAHLHDLRTPVPPTYFMSLAQHPDYVRGMEVRTAVADAGTLAIPIQRAIASVDASFPVGATASIQSRLDAVLGDDRMIAGLAGAFGLLALGMACFGLYGVMSYQVARRNGEFGIRMALGARPTSVLCIVLRHAVAMVLAGIVIGLPAALIAGHAVRSLLYGIPAADPTSFALALAALLALPTLAALLPAWQATRVDPIRALNR